MKMSLPKRKDKSKSKSKPKKTKKESPLKFRPEIVDPNFATVRKWWYNIDKELEVLADGKVSTDSSLIDFLQARKSPGQAAAKLVDFIDVPLIQNTDLSTLKRKHMTARLGYVYELVVADYPELADDDEGSHFSRTYSPLVRDLLKLWYGCLVSAKTVAYMTHAGRNTKKYRGFAMTRLWGVAAEDRSRIIWAGLKAGPWLRKLRNQSVSYNGMTEVQIKMMPPIRYFNQGLVQKGMKTKPKSESKSSSPVAS